MDNLDKLIIKLNKFRNKKPKKLQKSVKNMYTKEQINKILLKVRKPDNL